ncbi:MAG TPA: FAD-binding domain [Frateuria sp.]|uniref:FAD-binding domain n=1 Tax=Frateuria sp. TaxID=2211372 RepID=UPI002D7EF4C7|nr:FAD-binding domain [Frateuria sp.]HET6804975.1 FAD-binding domain [Frateuria sp.]
MTASSLRVAISGAGVAGPALAHWLLRCGHRPTLIEQAPAFRTGGYIIDFWGTGYRIAQRMGIEQAVRAAGYQVQRLESVDDEGRVQASMHTDVFERLTDGLFTSLPRGDLAATIYATVADSCETLFGDSITAIDPRHDRVDITLGNGGARSFDLVVGADGLHSNVRRLVFGPDTDFEHYLGCRVAACVVDGYRPRDELVYVTHNVPGRQAARFTLRGDRSLFLFVFRSQDTTDPGGLGARKALLRRKFADAGWECPRMLDALDDAEDLYLDVVSQVRMANWSRGCVALIGDAAACISLLGGEGTGLAMTEAYTLAGELQRAGGDYRQAFPAYEARLRSLIARKQRAAQGFIGFFAARTALGVWLRNLGIRAMNKPWLTGLIAGSVRDDFDLPDYGM